MTDSRIAPTTVPITRPSPPLSAVPPTTTAAIASSSHKQAGGRRGRAEARHVQHRGHADAHAEQHVGDDLHARRRVSPRSARTCSLEPIACTWRPNAVRLSIERAARGRRRETPRSAPARRRGSRNRRAHKDRITSCRA